VNFNIGLFEAGTDLDDKGDQDKNAGEE